ncbi:DUF4176 domain-containing protein [uncultured Parolsenella sp.]|uniref:DUF4176 domain-containing protein n=1 Tax=uncultured Parolsenella sp. TaxID=2083008 RepID=UPI0027D976DB|nr:DUF4176 domain-containing protein [uncultured Parolsenella sp.]
MVSTKDWLPLGSVVHIDGYEGFFFIIGYMQMTESGVWDYAGRPYPMGFMGEDKDICFNREDIDGLYYVGYQDVNSVQYQNYLVSQEPLLAKLKQRVAAGESVEAILAEQQAAGAASPVSENVA